MTRIDKLVFVALAFAGISPAAFLLYIVSFT